MGRNKMFSPKATLLCIVLITLLSLRSDVSGKPKHLLIETEDYQKGAPNPWETEAINPPDNNDSAPLKLSGSRGKSKHGPGSIVPSKGLEYPGGPGVRCPRKG